MTPATAKTPAPRHMLVRLRGEPPDAHRALILYAMGGVRCSLRIASKAARRNESSIRNWRRTWEWERRIAETPDAEVEAYLVYQSEYLPQYGAGAVIRLCENIVHPLGFLAELDREVLKQDAIAHGYPEDEPERAKRASPRKEIRAMRPGAATPPSFVMAAADPASAAGFDGRAGGRTGAVENREARAASRAADVELGKRLIAALGIGEPEVPDTRVPAASTAPVGKGGSPGGGAPPVPPTPPAPVDRDMMLIDGALGYIAGKIKAGEVKARISDIAVLMRLKLLLRGEATSRVALQVSPGSPSPPTVRLLSAGDDPVARRQAMREDLADLTAIMDGIEASEMQAPVNDGKVLDAMVAAIIEPESETA